MGLAALWSRDLSIFPALCLNRIELLSWLGYRILFSCGLLADSHFFGPHSSIAMGSFLLITHRENILCVNFSLILWFSTLCPLDLWLLILLTLSRPEFSVLIPLILFAKSQYSSTYVTSDLNNWKMEGLHWQFAILGSIFDFRLWRYFMGKKCDLDFFCAVGEGHI